LCHAVHRCRLASPEIGFRLQAAIAAAGTDNSGLGEKEKALQFTTKPAAQFCADFSSVTPKIAIKKLSLMIGTGHT
jgi:hypothetical protein